MANLIDSRILLLVKVYQNLNWAAQNVRLGHMRSVGRDVDIAGICLYLLKRFTLCVYTVTRFHAHL